MVDMERTLLYVMLIVVGMVMSTFFAACGLCWLVIRHGGHG